METGVWQGDGVQCETAECSGAGLWCGAARDGGGQGEIWAASGCGGGVLLRSGPGRSLAAALFDGAGNDLPRGGLVEHRGESQATAGEDGQPGCRQAAE